MNATNASLVFLFVLAVLSAAKGLNVLKYRSHREDVYLRKIMKMAMEPIILERNQPIEFFWKWGLDPNQRLSHFSWNDCGGSSAKVKMNDLRVSPDPVSVPGNINIAFNLNITDDFPDSISGDTVLKKKFGPIFVKIPCMDNFGSCHYDDVCAMLSQIPQCPDPLTQHQIPCKCPFKKGNYAMPSSEFQLTASPPSGDYTYELNLHRKGTFIGCLSLALSLQDA